MQSANTTAVLGRPPLEPIVIRRSTLQKNVPKIDYHHTQLPEKKRGHCVAVHLPTSSIYIRTPDSSSRSSQAAKQPTIQRRAFIDKRYLGQLRTVFFFNGKKQLLRAASKYKKVSYIRGLA